ncbi:hypothetical protein N7522_003337 [Penicillium canescens]|nr:hypothetical protein N7522_003337 [Penicillium canescens]
MGAPNEYEPPTQGIFALLPSALTPYAELMRLHRLAGCYFYYCHYVIGLSFAACVAPSPPKPSLLVVQALYFMAWVLILRGAMCTWNDNIDHGFDRQVARTRLRPIARGSVSTVQGHVFLLLQLVVGIMILQVFPPSCLFYAAITTLAALFYPFCKRVTHLPQVFLGLGFGLAIFMTGAALNVDFILQHSSNGGDGHRHRLAALCLYVVSVLYTVLVDTLYAYQDMEDDMKAGVGSLAVRLGKSPKLVFSFMAAAQVIFLVAVGILSQFSAIYFVGSCSTTALVLVSMVSLVNLTDPASCAWWFGPGSCLLGASMTIGMIGEYAKRQVSSAYL